MSIPKEYRTVSDGYYDHVTALTHLNKLKKVNISEFRNIADKLRMVIVPIEYVEDFNMFNNVSGASDLFDAYIKFKTLLEDDPTRKYELYLLCPISYYSIWSQIKSDSNKEIYYPEYFDSVFQTLELMIPTQRNLYIGMKNNEANITAASDAFKENIQQLSTKITKLSTKINNLERKFIQAEIEKQKMESAARVKRDQHEEIKMTIDNLNLSAADTVNMEYLDLDPVLFAVEKGTDIVTSNNTSIVGLCWGKDLDDAYALMKNITIYNKGISAHNVNKYMLSISADTRENIEKKIINYIMESCNECSASNARQTTSPKERHIVFNKHNYKIEYYHDAGYGWEDFTVLVYNGDEKNYKRSKHHIPLEEQVEQLMFLIRDDLRWGDKLNTYNLYKIYKKLTA
jgi:phosphotransferase system IIB component